MEMGVLRLDAGDIEKRLADLSDFPEEGGRSRHTELYFEPSMGDDEPLVILHHIRKTAGTSLRKVIKANYPTAQFAKVPDLSYSKQMAELGYRKDACCSRARLLALHREIWERLALHERRSLRVVASHEANFLQPFVDRQTIVISLIRQPVERVLSAYYFKNRSSSRIKSNLPLEETYRRMSGKEPTAILNELYLFNGQARSILAPFYDTRSLQLTAGASADAELWRKRLFTLVDEVYFIGISERFDEFIAVLSKRLGWQDVFSPRMKVNTERPQSDAIAPQLLRTIADYNWLDLELYKRQLESFSKTGGGGK